MKLLLCITTAIAATTISSIDATKTSKITATGHTKSNVLAAPVLCLFDKSCSEEPGSCESGTHCYVENAYFSQCREDEEASVVTDGCFVTNEGSFTGTRFASMHNVFYYYYVVIYYPFVSYTYLPVTLHVTTYLHVIDGAALWTVTVVTPSLYAVTTGNAISPVSVCLPLWICLLPLRLLL